eukprot:2223003-Lingulodinium_polyedra.AAC.1
MSTASRARRFVSVFCLHTGGRGADSGQAQARDGEWDIRPTRVREYRADVAPRRARAQLWFHLPS